MWNGENCESVKLNQIFVNGIGFEGLSRSVYSHCRSQWIKRENGAPPDGRITKERRLEKAFRAHTLQIYPSSLLRVSPYDLVDALHLRVRGSFIPSSAATSSTTVRKLGKKKPTD